MHAPAGLVDQVPRLALPGLRVAVATVGDPSVSGGGRPAALVMNSLPPHGAHLLPPDQL
jgi:hypothetical protein